MEKQESCNHISHSKGAQIWVAEQMKRLGITDYRFCLENDCYVCDRGGHFFAVCKRQLSRNGNLVEQYGVRPLKGSLDRYGYVTYRMTVDGVKKHMKAHRLMLNAWLGEQSDLVVNHIDGDKQNNALSNLEWCTVAENNAHAIRIGLFDPHSIKQEYLIPPAEWMTIYILHHHMGLSFCELARRYKCCHGTISAIVERLDRVMQEADYGSYNNN